MTSGDESEAALSFRQRFSDVFRNSTTFDTARATAVTKLLRLFYLLLLVLPLRRTRSQQVQARSFTRIGSRSRDRVSSAVGPSSSESDGVMDANNVISLSRRVHVVVGRRGGPVARAMGVSLPRSRALLRFLPSFPLGLLSISSLNLSESARVVLT